jgi:hypothetical protein
VVALSASPAAAGAVFFAACPIETDANKIRTKEENANLRNDAFICRLYSELISLDALVGVPDLRSRKKAGAEQAPASCESVLPSRKGQFWG